MYIDHGTCIERASDGARIPKDEWNADYQAFVLWLSQGNQALQPPPPTHEQLWERAITEMRALRQPILDVLDGLQATATALNQPDRALLIETAKQGLRDITKLDLSACTTYEEMRATVGVSYAALVASLPADIRLAFKEATQ